MFEPRLPDRKGRGETCALIDRLARELMQYQKPKTRDELHAFTCLTRRLDEARAKLHRLYPEVPRSDTWQV